MSDFVPVIDIETTGLDLDNDRILEVGMAIVNMDDFSVIDTMSFVMHTLTPGYASALRRMGENDYVYNMHKKSGLLDAMNSDTAIHFEEASDRMLEMLTAYYGTDHQHRPPMLGSSIHFDREMIRQSWPEVEERFFYRNIDVSSIKELCMRWNPDVYAKLDRLVKPQKAHRVIPDIEDTVNELRFYRDNFLFVV